eukprot:1392532-Amorphochlora_amoeboformis.AAC.1
MDSDGDEKNKQVKGDSRAVIMITESFVMNILPVHREADTCLYICMCITVPVVECHDCYKHFLQGLAIPR